MQIRQRVFKHTAMQVLHLFLDKICKLLTYHTPFYHRKVINLQKWSGFLAHLVFACRHRNTTILHLKLTNVVKLSPEYRLFRSVYSQKNNSHTPTSRMVIHAHPVPVLSTTRCGAWLWTGSKKSQLYSPVFSRLFP